MEECGYDTDQLLHVLYEEKHKQTNYLLDQMLKKHGYKISGNKYISGKNETTVSIIRRLKRLFN